MRLLAFDTLGPALSAAAATEGGIVLERAETMERGQAERLLPLLDAVLGAVAWDWRDVDLIAVSVGPGGFTAIRTGIAVARALALALGRPVLGLGTLEVMAQAALAVGGDGPLLVVKDLRREQLAAQSFAAGGVAASDAMLLDRDEALAAVSAAERVAGELGILRALLPEAKPVIEAAPTARYVAAAALRDLERGERPMAGTELRPFYLRAPDARVAAGRPLVAALAVP